MNRALIYVMGPRLRGDDREENEDENTANLSPRNPRPKHRRPKPYMRGPQHNRLFEIPAHAHAEFCKPMLRRQLFQQREMQRRRFIDRGNRHQPVNHKTNRTAMCQQRGQTLNRHTGLLVFRAGIDLHKTNDRFFLPPALRLHRVGQLLPVDGFNDIEQRHRITHLVAL